MENKVIKSEFLNKLQTALVSGDPSKGSDVIKKINEIIKLADGMSGNEATDKFDKRLEDAGVKPKMEALEIEKVTVQSEKDKILREKENEKLKMIADITNARKDLNSLNSEFCDTVNKYEKLIEKQKEDLKILKIKFEAKFDISFDEKEIDV